MNRQENDHPDPEWRAACASLKKDLSPPPEVEQRVVDALRRRGRLRAPGDGGPAWLSRPALRVAAALALLALGGLGQRYLFGPSGIDAAEPTFVLLLREEEPIQGDERLLYEEYAAWARDQAGAAALVGGERLAPGSRVVGGSASGGATQTAAVTGYFLLSVSTYDEALRIARSCPHVRHGGAIEVRRIDRL